MIRKVRFFYTFSKLTDALTELGAFMRTEFLCISVLRVASGPRVKLAGCKSALNPPPPPPVVYSTDRSKAVVLLLFLIFVAFCSNMVSTLLSVFPICVVMLALWSMSSIAAHFAFCFTILCYDASIFGQLQQLLILLSVLLFVIKSGIGTQGEVSRL